jgi:membrane protein required for colicin V production
MAAVSAIDWIGLLIVLTSLALGAWRGLVYEALLLGGWVLAFVAARWSAGAIGHRLPMGESSEPLRHAVGFLVVFIGTAFVFGFFAYRARRAALLLGVRSVDRVFGAAFGAVRGVLLLLVLAVIVLKTPVHEEGWWRDSIGARRLEYALVRINPWLPPSLRRYLSD